MEGDSGYTAAWGGASTTAMGLEDRDPRDLHVTWTNYKPLRPSGPCLSNEGKMTLSPNSLPVCEGMTVSPS